MGRRGSLRPAAEPGVRLPLPDRAVLPRRRAGRGPRLGGAAAVVGAGAGRRLRRHRPSGAGARRAQRPRLPAGRRRLRDVATDAHHAGTDLQRELADGPGAVGAAAARGRCRTRVAADRRRLGRGRGRPRRRHQRRGGLRGHPARGGVAADPYAGSPPPRADAVVAGAHPARHPVVAGAVGRDGGLQPAVPAVDRDRLGHDLPHHRRRRPARHVQLGRLHRHHLPRRTRPAEHALPRARRRSPAAPRCHGPDAAQQPPPRLPGARSGGRAAAGHARPRGGRAGLGCRHAARPARRGPLADPERPQVRPDHPSAPGHRARVRRRGAACGIHHDHPGDRSAPAGPCRADRHRRGRRGSGCRARADRADRTARAGGGRARLLVGHGAVAGGARLRRRRRDRPAGARLGVRPLPVGVSRRRAAAVVGRLAVGGPQRRPPRPRRADPDARRRRAPPGRGPRVAGARRRPGTGGGALRRGPQRPHPLRRRPRPAPGAAGPAGVPGTGRRADVRTGARWRGEAGGDRRAGRGRRRVADPLPRRRGLGGGRRRACGPRRGPPRRGGRAGGPAGPRRPRCARRATGRAGHRPARGPRVRGRRGPAVRAGAAGAHRRPAAARARLRADPRRRQPGAGAGCPSTQRQPHP